MMTLLLSSSINPNLESIFRLIDEDNNNVITKDELQRFLNVNNENKILIEIFDEVGIAIPSEELQE